MDFDDGEVRFRTSLAVLSGGMSPDNVEHMVFCNLNAVDRFIAAIMKVIYADIPPKAALMKKPLMAGRASRFELN